MLNESKIGTYLGQALSRGGDWAELFCEETVKQQTQLSDKSLKQLGEQRLNGAGIRVTRGGEEYYAYTNDLSETGMTRLASELSQAIGREAAPARVIALAPAVDSIVPRQVTSGLAWADRVALVRRADRAARALSPQIMQVSAECLEETQRILVANSDGRIAHDQRSRARFLVTVVAASGDTKQFGYEAPGTQGVPDFLPTLDVEAVTTEAAETALRMLKADYAPQGKMTVIIDSGFGGVIFHEACGHSLEASAVARKATVLADKLGQQIAASCVSAIDDGTLEKSWGSSQYDDEGQPTQRNLLIENGVLRSYLVDRHNGQKLGLKSTGSSRRQSYRYAPTSRMNNTYILPGPDALAQMIADTDYGLYAKKMGGGSVNPATGEFNFAVLEAYLIKNGKITAPVRGAVLIGRGEDILKNIDRVGSELKLAQGMCGAASGWIPVNVGQPALRVQNILVGGQKA